MAGIFTEKCCCGLIGVLIIAVMPAAQIALGAVYIHECPVAPGVPLYVMVCGIAALLLLALLALPTILCPTSPRTIWNVCAMILVPFVFIWFLYGSYQVYSVYPPNYEKNITNSSVYTPSAPDNHLILENQNQSLPDHNQTRMISNNQTSKRLIQTSTLSNISTKTNMENLNTARPVMAAEDYCNRTVYLFAFWTITLVYAFAGNGLLITACLYGFMKVVTVLTKYVTT